MAFSAMKERYRNKINEVVLGATKEGGTRGYTVTVGSESALPFLHLKVKSPTIPS